MNDSNYTPANEEKSRMLSIGVTLQGGKYRINNYLGSGGFGNTYLATNTLLDLPVVLKEFFIKGVTTRSADGNSVSISLTENRPLWEKMLEKFNREARHMFKINHPNIVRVHDFFEENNTAYYVMDLVGGDNLHDRIKKTGRPLTEQEVRDNILPQVLNALDRIHSENLWHLDLKPANLMQDRNGTIKLIDFGASKQSNSGEGITTTNLAYTPGYAAPEQVLQQTKYIGPWTDVFALGATLYNLLTNKKPPTQIEIDDLGDNAFDFSGVNVSDQMRYVITRLMEPRRMQRPQNIAAVRQLLAAPVPTDEITRIGADEITRIATENGSDERTKIATPKPPANSGAIKSEPKKKSRLPLIAAAVTLAIIAAVAIPLLSGSDDADNRQDAASTSTPAVASTEQETSTAVQPEEIKETAAPAKTTAPTQTPATPKQTKQTTTKTTTAKTNPTPSKQLDNIKIPDKDKAVSSSQKPASTTTTPAKPTPVPQRNITRKKEDDKYQQMRGYE